ncbi:MAG TPA: hypothetical protein VN222_03970, partial [Novosphingobium sp.]|nr:hypothetical protein [Novosphingobium sp.]
PETVNRSQEDEAAQAQTVAAQAQGLAQEPPSPGNGVKAPVNPADFIEEDVQDLVEHMLAMTASGQIDMGAYRGERDDSDAEENAPRQMRER